jgi:hypothetical protein
MLHSIRALPAALLVLCMGTAQAAIPPNDDCATPTVIGSLPFTETIDVSSATGAVTDPLLLCKTDYTIEPGDRTVWYSFTAGAEDVFLDVSTAGSDANPILAVYTGTCGALTLLDCNDNHPGLEENARSFVVVATGETVLIEVADAQSLTLTAQPAPAGQLAKAQPEFVVNSHMPGYQGFYYKGGISTCAGPNDTFVVAWEDYPLDGDKSGIFARLFDGNALPVGPQFPVNVGTVGSQEQPSVACSGTGEFVVAWSDGNAAVARRFDATGSALTGDVAVTGDGFDPSVTTDTAGNFVVAFSQGGYVKARRFDSTGTALGGEFSVSSGGSEDYFDSAGSPAGDLVVVWQSYIYPYEVVQARQIDSGGVLGPEFTAVTNTDYSSYAYPKVAMNAGGEFVVAWGARDDDNRGLLRAKRFGASGTPLSGDIDAGTTDPGRVLSIDVALQDDGSFVVTRDGNFHDYGIRGRHVAADDVPAGDSEFEVESIGVYDQYGPEAAALSGGDFVIAWAGFDGFDGSYFAEATGVNARRLTVATSSGPACAATPAAGCRLPTKALKSKLLFVDDPDDARDQMRWKWVKGEETTQADWGDPTTDTGYALCLYGPGDTLIYGSLVDPGGTCGTKPCWKALGNPAGSKGYRMKSKTREPHGVQKLILKVGIEGKAKIVAKGGRELLFDGPGGVAPLPLPLPATMQLQSTAGECWQATYEAEGVGKNEAGFFKGSGS